MRRTALVLNAIVVAFFVGFLAYTFIARRHLDGLARDFVTEKTIEYADPAVDVAEAALETPLVKRLLSDEKAAVIREEIDEYRTDPAGYIGDLTRGGAVNVPRNVNPLLAKVAALKQRIRAYYDETLVALITDLRVFAISNLIAGLIALGLAWRSPQGIRKSIVWFSILMCVAVLCCSYIYIDGLTFFRILVQAHLGWSYAVILCVMIVGLGWDHLRGSSGVHDRTETRPEES